MSYPYTNYGIVNRPLNTLSDEEYRRYLERDRNQQPYEVYRYLSSSKYDLAQHLYNKDNDPYS